MNLDRIASLLSSGLKPSQVATIIGCTPARISQLLSQEDFKLILADKTTLLEEKDIEEITLSSKYSAAEHALINQVMEMAPTADLRDVTAALRVVGDRQEKMRTRLTPVSQNSHNNQTVVVSITLPHQAIPVNIVEMTKEREVISIGSQTLAPLNSTAVTNLFNTMQKIGEPHDNPTDISSSKVSPPKTIPIKEFPSSEVSLKEAFYEYDSYQLSA